MFEFCEIDLFGVEVERSLENAERFVLIEHSDGKEITDLEDEASGFLKERGLGSGDVPSQSEDLLLTGKMRAQIGKRFPWILGKLGKRASERARNPKSLVQHHVINGEGKSVSALLPR